MIASSAFRRLAFLAGFVFAGAINAHAQHSHSHAATNGGQVQKIGAYEAELAVRGSQATLYLMDEADKKVDASGMSASVQVLATGNQQKTVELKSVGENKLSGTIDFPVEGKFRATVTLRNAGGDVGKARYSLDAK